MINVCCFPYCLLYWAWNALMKYACVFNFCGYLISWKILCAIFPSSGRTTVGLNDFIISSCLSISYLPLSLTSCIPHSHLSPVTTMATCRLPRRAALLCLGGIPLLWKRSNICAQGHAVWCGASGKSPTAAKETPAPVLGSREGQNRTANVWAFHTCAWSSLIYSGLNLGLETLASSFPPRS